MKHKGKGLIFTGLLLIAAALFLTGYNLFDQMRAQRSAAQAAAQLAERLPQAGEAAVPDYLMAPEMEMPVETIDGVDYVGVLRIPSLALELPVISQWSYPLLKIAPCRYSGSMSHMPLYSMMTCLGLYCFSSFFSSSVVSSSCPSTV